MSATHGQAVLDFAIKNGGAKRSLVNTITNNVLQKMYPYVTAYVNRLLTRSQKKHRSKTYKKRSF